MIGQDFGSSPADASPPTFAEALDQLKAHGCLVLVVGPIGDDAKYAGCRRLLGDDNTKSRRRLFIETSTNGIPARGAGPNCSHGGPANAHTLTYETSARGAAATASDSSNPTQHVSVEGTLDDLLEAADASMESLADADGFDPAELRVCVDDLDAMIANDADIDVVEFLRDLRALVLEHNGMCHAHLSRNVPGAPIDAIVHYFDAIVEVDSSNVPRQRWTIRHTGIKTDWLEL